MGLKRFIFLYLSNKDIIEWKVSYIIAMLCYFNQNRKLIRCVCVLFFQCWLTFRENTCCSAYNKVSTRKIAVSVRGCMLSHSRPQLAKCWKMHKMKIPSYYYNHPFHSISPCRSIMIFLWAAMGYGITRWDGYYRKMKNFHLANQTIFFFCLQSCQPIYSTLR